MAGGYLNAQLENVPGNETNTPTLSTKSIFMPIITGKPDLGVDPLERDDELRGILDSVPVVPESYAPAWSATSRMYPDTVGFLLTQLFGAPTTTTGNGVITDPSSATVPTGAFRHVWTTTQLFGPSAKTAQMIFAYKDQSVYMKVKGAAIDTFAIDTPEKGGAQVKVNGPALHLARVANPSLSPAYESLAILPFERGGLTLPSWLTSSGTHEDFNVSIANPVEVVRSMGIESRFPDIMELTGAPMLVTGSIPQRQLDADDWDALVNATAFTALARWKSTSIIASSYAYQLWLSMPNCQYVAGDADELTNTRRLGATFNWKASTADGTTPAATITLVNATTNYN